MRIPLSLFLIVCATVAAILQAAETGPTVSVAGGEIRGRATQRGGADFKGIPFAQSPVGDLRWKDPAPVKPWTGVRDAAAFGPSCMQEDLGYNTQEAHNVSEDCLYVNVWTPVWPAKSPLPVMIWLYGGGETGGGASADYMDGTAISRRGIVFVTINYRLGIFGFLAHPGLTAETPHHSSGNYGLLDVLAALKWVHAHIAKFGGDPAKVTLFGQSAGGINTAYLLTSPLSKGLITYAIQESGSPIHDIGSLKDDEELGVKFAAALKAPAGAAEAVKFLRAMPAADMLKASVKELGRSGPLMYPHIDGYLLPVYPALAFRDGKESPVPIITGNTAMEELRNYDLAGMKRVIKANFGSLAPQAEEFYGLTNGLPGNTDPLYGPPLRQIPTDTKHRCGAVAETMWRNQNGGRTTYQYQFDPPVAGEAGTKHTAEIPFVFGNLLSTGTMAGPWTEADRKISNDIQTYWTNFAKTGNPNTSSLNGLPEWPKADAAKRYLEFTIHDGPVVKENLRPQICGLYIEGLKETISANTAGTR
jgi:para-nitrobenzyl esterase